MIEPNAISVLQLFVHVKGRSPKSLLVCHEVSCYVHHHGGQYGPLCKHLAAHFSGDVKVTWLMLPPWLQWRCYAPFCTLHQQPAADYMLNFSSHASNFLKNGIACQWVWRGLIDTFSTAW